VDGARKTLILLLAAAAVPAVAQTLSFSPRPACFTDGSLLYQVTAATRADHVVKIDRDAATADIRIALIDTAEAADFVLVDDGDDAGLACRGRPTTIALGAAGRPADLTVGLMSTPDAADYRVFVRSQRFSPEAAVALFAVMRAANPQTLAGRR
jgi:hypothetical protein